MTPPPAISTSTNFHQRTPARKKIAPPLSTSIIAVPRSGCFITSAAGTRTSSAGTNRRIGRPISSGVSTLK